LTYLIGIIAALADCFASACAQSTFLCVKWERQTTDGTVAGISAFRLFEQNSITQLSHPFFTCSFMVRPMFFLALHAAISNEFTGGACLQFYFVDFCDAAGNANVSRLSVFAANHHFSLYFHSHQEERGARDKACVVLRWLSLLRSM
jgi:hypothetical protein